MSDQVIMNRL